MPSLDVTVMTVIKGHQGYHQLQWRPEQNRLSKPIDDGSIDYAVKKDFEWAKISNFFYRMYKMN